MRRPTVPQMVRYVLDSPENIRKWLEAHPEYPDERVLSLYYALRTVLVERGVLKREALIEKA